MLKEIITYVDPCSTGDADPAKYAAHLTAELSAEYPDAKITVTAGVGPDYISADSITEEERAMEFIHSCWDQYCEEE